MRLFPSNKDKLKVVTLCILAATTFWFFSALNKSDYTTRLEYPITFIYPDDSTYVLETLPEHVLVEVRGGGWNLLRKTLLLDTPPVEIALEDPVNTRYVTGESLSQQITEKLGEVQLDGVVTDTLFFRIDHAAEKQVYVAIDSSSMTLENTYRIISPISLSTRQATVMGPRTILKDLDDTLFISLPEQGINEDYQQEVPLEYSISDLVSILPETVDVSFEVASFDKISRSVKVSPQNFPVDSSLQILPNRVDVSFWIQDRYIDLIQDYDFEVIANLRSLDLEDSTINPVLESYPKFAEDITISPSKVRVRYAK